MTSLKQKTISGILWSFVDQFATLGISFIVGIILARILSPKEFGLIGMITVFIAVSTTFINSGFGSALIRKKDCSQADYSTVFFFNLSAGIIFYLLLYISSPSISRYFNEEELTLILRVLAFSLIIDALSLIQGVILAKRVDFKLQAKVSVISTTSAGVLGISLAYNGFGVWSLVYMQLVSRLLNTVLLWAWNKWKPSFVFSNESFKELFGFGGKLLLSGLIETIYRNIYYLIIGKYFNATQLGYYSRADQFNSVPSQSLTTIMSRVTYPVLAQMQEDKDRLKQSYKKMIKTIMFVSFSTMLGIAAVADSMILSLIGEKWEQSIIYLQLLCFVGMMYPLHALNLNILQVQGRSDLFLKLEIIKKMLAIPIIIIAIVIGIKAMIIGMWVSTLIAYYLNSYWSGRFINYPMREQVTDILPSFLLAITMALFVYIFGTLFETLHWVKLLLQILLGVSTILLFSELLKIEPYIELKYITINKIMNVFHGRK
ncbi:lipopolysaccharide biosynthesis protein [Bacteroidales bacterium]